MTQADEYRCLTEVEVQLLTQQGCRASSWSDVQVSPDFSTARVWNTQFSGSIQLGINTGSVDCGTGIQKDCGLYDARLHNCSIGDGVRIANVASHIANYRIEDGVCIEDVGIIQTSPGATFGNGVEIEPLNEGGGREVILFNRLDSQFAHLLCVHRYRPELIKTLRRIALEEVDQVRSDRGTIGAGSVIRHVKRMLDVNVGEQATIDSAASLKNGTILSTPEALTVIGVDVQADDFIVAEATHVTGGAIISKSFIGQGCRIGKQFSAEGSLFFANCEGFHGEACSIFAGPYTVTHHKSTLLIAGLFSFYNAGSGTNQSNHLYKLGPVHEGKLERGCKTGSFSYMMWPCRVGPFSVVLGKHTRTFDTSDFPFSYLEATPDGRCSMTPGFNVTTVGTVRDGQKWPARDRRTGNVKRDRIIFDVFSPLTVGRMLAGSLRMRELQEKTDRSVDTVNLNGTDVKRVLLRTGQKFYRGVIHMYLLEKVVCRIENALAGDITAIQDMFAEEARSIHSDHWIDVGGQLMPRERLDSLCDRIADGTIHDLDALNDTLDQIQAAYAADEWCWVREAYHSVFERRLEEATIDDLMTLVSDMRDARQKFLKQVLNDANKEFADAVRTGFGQDGQPEDADADFAAVRGEFDGNQFVMQLKQQIVDLDERVARVQAKLQQLG